MASDDGITFENKFPSEWDETLEFKNADDGEGVLVVRNGDPEEAFLLTEGQFQKLLKWGKQRKA